MSFEDSLYVSGDPQQLVPGKWYALISEKQQDIGGMVLTSNPPQYPAHWIYKFVGLESKEEATRFQEDVNVISVFRVSESYQVKRKYKQIKETIKFPKFDGFELDKNK